MKTLIVTVSIAGALVMTGTAQHQHDAALAARGKQVMGFDQETTTHHFILTRTGGRIEVTAKQPDDTKSIDEIRTHLRHLAPMFASGQFSAPALVHDQKVPGVDKMKDAGTAITYTFEEMNRGGRIAVVAATAEGVAAVHEFLIFQIKDHKTGDPLVVR